MSKRPTMRFLSNNSEWKEAPLGALCESITVGIANSATHAYVDDGIVMLRNQNIKENRLDDSDVIRIDEEFEKRYVNKRLKANDLIVARTGYPGTACVVPQEYEGAQTFTTLIARLKKGIDPYYASQYINSGYGKKYFIATQIGGGQKNSGAGILEDFPLVFPVSITDQKKIARYFSRIDALIMLHQNKYDKLLAYKKAMLGRMFPKDGADVPEVRFAGYTKAWKAHKLSEIATEITRNDPTSNAPIMMITAKDGFIEQSERYAFNNAGKSLKKYTLLKKGELAYNHGASKLRPYGSCFALNNADEARIPFVYHCFSVGDNNSSFLSVQLNGTYIEKQLRRIVSSSARMDGLLNISYDEYATVQIMMPETDEQNKIADYFHNLDKLISFNAKQVEKLKTLKTALLEKMFI